MNYFSSCITQLTILPLQILLPYQMFLKRVIYNWLLGEFSSNKSIPTRRLWQNHSHPKSNKKKIKCDTGQLSFDWIHQSSNNCAITFVKHTIWWTHGRFRHSMFTYPYSKWKLISKLLCSTIKSSKISTMIVCKNWEHAILLKK